MNINRLLAAHWGAWTRSLSVRAAYGTLQVYLCQLWRAKQMCATRCVLCLPAWLLAWLGLAGYSNPVWVIPLIYAMYNQTKRGSPPQKTTPDSMLYTVIDLKKQQQQGNSDNRRNKWQIVCYESYEITISVEMFVSVSVLQHICFFHVLSCTWWMFVLTYSSGFDNVQ